MPALQVASLLCRFRKRTTRVRSPPKCGAHANEPGPVQPTSAGQEMKQKPGHMRNIQSTVRANQPDEVLPDPHVALLNGARPHRLWAAETRWRTLHPIYYCSNRLPYPSGVPRYSSSDCGNQAENVAEAGPQARFGATCYDDSHPGYPSQQSVPGEARDFH